MVNSRWITFANLSIEKDPLTELIRRGAQSLLNRAVEIEKERMAELLERRLPDDR